MSCLGLRRATSSSCLRCCPKRGRSWPRVYVAWACSPSCQKEDTSWSQTSPLSVSDEQTSKPDTLNVAYVCAFKWIFTRTFFFFCWTEVDLNDESNKNESYDFRFVKWLIREKVHPSRYLESKCVWGFFHIFSFFFFFIKGLATIPVSAFFSPEHSKEFDKYIRFCFVKVNRDTLCKMDVPFFFTRQPLSIRLTVFVPNRKTPRWKQQRRS